MGRATIEQTLCLTDCLATIERSGISADQCGQFRPIGKQVAADQDPNGRIARSTPHRADRFRQRIQPVLTACGQSNHVEPVTPDGLNQDGVGRAALSPDPPACVTEHHSNDSEAKRMLFARTRRQKDAVSI